MGDPSLSWHSFIYINMHSWDFPVVQWFRLCPSNARGTGLIPGWELRSHMSHGVTKNWKNKTKPWTLGYLFYILGYNSTLHYLFCYSHWHRGSLSMRDSSIWFLCPLDTLFWTECLCITIAPPYSHAEALIPNMLVFRDGHLDIRVRWGHDGPHNRISAFIRRDTGEHVSPVSIQGSRSTPWAGVWLHSKKRGLGIKSTCCWHFDLGFASLQGCERKTSVV